MPLQHPDGLALRERLLALFERPAVEPLDDPTFEALALDIFTFQYEHVAPYAAWCDRRGVGPGVVTGWREIPAVPTAAFREVALVAGDPAGAAAVFRTSGTTAGTEARGRHYVLDLSIYRAALRPAFEAWVLPDGLRPRMLSLMPPAAELPDSSLAFMIDDLVATFGADGSGFFASVAGGLDVGELDRAVRAAIDADQPVCLLGTSFSFVHWLDALAAAGRRHRLPAGSRLMDTGGFKGHRRRIEPDELRHACVDRLGIPPGSCVNEYGMTEMLSQFYDSSLRLPDRPRRRMPPPWVRTLVVDPDTLRPLDSPGATGLLRHFDLANLGSVVAVQTEDVGRVGDGGLELLDRLAGAPARGCSIAMDELLASQPGRT